MLPNVSSALWGSVAAKLVPACCAPVPQGAYSLDWQGLLQGLIDKIRRVYESDWDSSDYQAQQMGVAMYFIDKLALRAGHEKEEDEADTVGCCNLKVGTRVALCCSADKCSGRDPPSLYMTWVAGFSLKRLASGACCA